MERNNERLIEKYMDNPNTLNVKAGICPAPPPPVASLSSGRVPTSRTKPSSSSAKRTTRRTTTADSAGRSKTSVTPEPQAAPEPFVCQICFDESQTQSFNLSCGHTFCKDCWIAFLTSKIREEGEASISCMAPDCSLIAPDSFVRDALAEDPETLKRHRELIVRHYVSCNSNLKFCPYPSCTFTVSCPSASSKSALTTIVPTVHCGDQHVFCFGCAIDSDHRPVICSVAKLWLKKCQDDSETANWIKSNTKECSKCQSTIEKNGGCKYVFFFSP